MRAVGQSAPELYKMFTRRHVRRPALPLRAGPWPLRRADPDPRHAGAARDGPAGRGPARGGAGGRLRLDACTDPSKPRRLGAASGPSGSTGRTDLSEETARGGASRNPS